MHAACARGSLFLWRTLVSCYRLGNMLTLWIDVAPLRTGGRTVQQVMSQLAHEGLLLHRESLILGGTAAYAHTLSDWRRMLHALNQPCPENGHSKPLVVALQITDDRAADFWNTWLPSVREFREKTQRSSADTAACSRVVRAALACRGARWPAVLRSSRIACTQQHCTCTSCFILGSLAHRMGRHARFHSASKILGWQCTCACASIHRC
jgi:hypothetical protein